MRTGGLHHGPAFTLLEAMIVVLVVGVLAASAVPAVNLLVEMNRATASHEVARTVELARARAMATGRPHGVWFSVREQAMRSVWIETTNAAPTPARAQTGDEQPLVHFRSFGNVSLSVYTGGDGVSTEGTIWFGSDGTPQARSSTGTLLGAWASDATLRIEGESLIAVRRLSGLVQ